MQSSVQNIKKTGKLLSYLPYKHFEDVQYLLLSISSLTDAQMKIVDKYERLVEKDIADSHFFHTDTSGSK